MGATCFCSAGRITEQGHAGLPPTGEPAWPLQEQHVVEAPSRFVEIAFANAMRVMPDFVTILKSAIDGVGEYGPAVRERVYQRARLALATRLESVGPTPPSVAERQTLNLEEAIVEVENWYISTVADPIAELRNTFDYRTERPPSPDETAATESSQATVQVVEVGGGSNESTTQPSAPADEGERAPSQLAGPASPGELNFEISAPRETNAQMGIDIPDSISPDVPSIEGRAPLGTATRTSVHKLEWGTSSKCGICHKWAFCIDPTHCWHRADR